MKSSSLLSVLGVFTFFLFLTHSFRYIDEEVLREVMVNLVRDILIEIDYVSAVPSLVPVVETKDSPHLFTFFLSFPFLLLTKG